MDAPSPRTAKVELTRNYVPRGTYALVGHNRPRIVEKDAAGREHVRQEAAFVPDEMYPPKQAGVGFGPVTDKDGKLIRNGKIWAGTIIEVPEDEARDMRAKKIGEIYL